MGIKRHKKRSVICIPFMIQSVAYQDSLRQTCVSFEQLASWLYPYLFY